MSYGSRVVLAFLGGALFVGGVGMVAAEIAVRSVGGPGTAALVAGLGFGLLATAFVRPD